MPPVLAHGRSLSQQEIIDRFTDHDFTCEGLRESDYERIKNTEFSTRNADSNSWTPRERRLRLQLTATFKYAINVGLSWILLKFLEKKHFDHNQKNLHYSPLLNLTCIVEGFTLLKSAVIHKQRIHEIRRNAVTARYLADEVAAGRARVYLGNNPSHVYADLSQDSPT